MANETNQTRTHSKTVTGTAADLPLKSFERDSQEKRPAAVTILKPLEEVYAFVRDFSNHPRFIEGLKRVTEVSPKVSHWVAEGGGDKTEEWDSELIAEEPDRMFAWRTIGDSSFEQTGVVMFERATGGRGTVVSMKVNYENKVGQVVNAFKKLVYKDPDTHAAINLRRLKALLETGEVPTVKGQPSGRDEQSNH